MSNWLDGTPMSNVWVSFKAKLADSLFALSNDISKNTSDISDRITKKQYGISNAFRYKSTDIITSSSGDKYKYLCSCYAQPSASNYLKTNYRKTITSDGRIFEYDCTNYFVIEIDPTTGNITKYNLAVQNTNIEYKWYIGTYVDGENIYSYIWGTGTSGWGIFKIKHGDETYANSISSLYIYDIAQHPEYYKDSNTTPIYLTNTTYLHTNLSTLIDDTVYIVCNVQTSNSNPNSKYEISFVWDGSYYAGTDSIKPKKLNVNTLSSYYNNNKYHYQRGVNIVTDNDATYSDSYKLSINSSTDDTVTLKIEEVVPKVGTTAAGTIYPCGFYDDYVVFGNLDDVKTDVLLFLPKNDSSYYEVVPFKETTSSNTPYYNRLIFSHLNNGKNYMFIPVLKYVSGFSSTDDMGIVLKNLDE